MVDMHRGANTPIGSSSTGANSHITCIVSMLTIKHDEGDLALTIYGYHIGVGTTATGVGGVDVLCTSASSGVAVAVAASSGVAVGLGVGIGAVLSGHGVDAENAIGLSLASTMILEKVSGRPE